MNNSELNTSLTNIFGNLKPVDHYREISEAGYAHFVNRIERVLLKLVGTIEKAVENFDEDAWYPLVECGRVTFLSKGRGIYIQDGVYASVMLKPDGVSIRIMEGLELAKGLELKTILFAYASNENLARAIKEKFDEFKKDGVTDITIMFEGFKYTNQ